MASTATVSEQRSDMVGIVTLLLSVLAFARGQLTAFRKAVVELANDAARMQGGEAVLANPDAQLGVLREVRIIGGAVVGIAVITLVVNEVLTVNAINNSTGPFTGVIDSIETTGVAAMTLLVVGLLVLAAAAIMRYMGQGF